MGRNIFIEWLIVFGIVCFFEVKGADITEDIQYLVYFSNSISEPSRVLAGVAPQLIYNPSTKIKILLHGWMDACNASYILDFKDLYLTDPNNIVITMDWCSVSKLDYDISKEKSKRIGDHLAELIQCIVEEGIDPRHIEILCFCMGCQIAGRAAKHTINTNLTKIGRITALDPAGPSYFYDSWENKLGSCDATVVFVIHTDAFKFGFGDPCGNIDIYPNGGRHPQPGCPEGRNYIETSMCSHRRAIYYYLEALNNSNFKGIECPTYSDYRNGLCSKNKVVDFSEKISPTDSGLYFTRTSHTRPFLKKKSLS